MKMKYPVIIHHLILMILIPKEINMEAKFLVKDAVKMIIGEETSIVSTVTNSIYHIPLYILTLNKSIVKVRMDK